MVKRKNLQTLQQDLDVLSEEVSDLAAGPPPGDASPALNVVKKRIRRVRADFQRVASDLGSDSPATAVAMADKIVDPVEDTLSERPIATIALGFGLGFIFGMVWGRG